MGQIPFINRAPFGSYTTISIYIYIYIYKTVPHISFMWYLQCILEHCTIVIYACALSELLISRFSVIVKSICVNAIGARYSETLSLKLDTDVSIMEGLNGVNRQPSNDLKINRQPSKTEYFYRQPSNERAKISHQTSQI